MQTLAAGDHIAAKQDVGTDVLYDVNGDDVTTATSADAYGRLGQGALSTAATSLVGPAAGHAYIIDSMKITNTGSSTRIVTFYATKNSTTYDATTQWGTAITLAANESAEWTGAGWMTYDSTGQPKVASGEPVSKVTHIFQGTTTYTPSSGVRALYVECVGGGGGGGGPSTAITNAAGAGGGGGGAYSAVYTTTVKTSFSCVVGAGGTGVSGAAGNVGADTTFDSASICTAKGGTGGLTMAVTAGPVMGGAGVAGGASASGVGDIKADGGPGGWGIMLAAAQASSGQGGDSAFGGGGKAVKSATAVGTAGGVYGGGGAGGCIISGGASQLGGAGGNGLIRVTEFQ